MTVHVLELRFDYEPGDVLGVYATLELAKAAAEAHATLVNCSDRPDWHGTELGEAWSCFGSYVVTRHDVQVMPPEAG